MAASNPISDKTPESAKSARSTQTTRRVRTDPRSTAELRLVQARTRTRNTIANFITVMMLLLTLTMLGWIAYQLNNPIALNLSQFLRH